MTTDSTNRGDRHVGQPGRPYEWVIVAAWWVVGLVYLLRLSPRQVQELGP